MREIGAFEAKNKFGQLLDWVERGEEIAIPRRGKEVARLFPQSLASTVQKPMPPCVASASAPSS
jgi:prevent-host-death family protein